MLHKLVYAVGRAGRLSAGQSLAGKVGDTGVEASFYESRVELHKVLHLLLLDDLVHMGGLGRVQVVHVHFEGFTTVSLLCEYGAKVQIGRAHV